MPELKQITRKIKLLSVTAVLMFLCASANSTLYAQTTNSIPEQRQTDDRKLKLVEALERAQTEVKASRKYVDALEKEVASKLEIINAQRKRQTLADEAIAGLQLQVGQLQLIIKNTEDALKIQKREIESLKKELDQTNRKLKRARTLNKYLILSTGALIALKLIFR